VLKQSHSIMLCSYLLLISGAGVYVAIGGEQTYKVWTQSCTTSLQEAFNRVNKVQWEPSFHSDSEMICSSAHQNASYFKSAGLSTSDAELATFSAWVQIKKKYDFSGISVSTSELEGLVKEYRLLIVSSDPSQADVTIDSKPCSTPTECRYWVPPGTHEVVVSKKGYQTERKQQTVTNERVIRISLNLHP
jgi:hypothetical protein